MPGLAVKAVGISFSRMIPRIPGHEHKKPANGRRMLTIHNDRAMYLPEANQLLDRAKLLRDDGALDDQGLLRAQECTEDVIKLGTDGKPVVDQAVIEELRCIVKAARDKKAARALHVIVDNPHPLGMVEEEPLVQAEPVYPKQGRIL
eukprot:CAMPEP_0202811642 /NCGR_PEP_ID=MMETSP1389-20130828/3455_1 /ASSEMBLY_ACC=CAM_ASM_000865 /TAXON_ID=302021 /ORGANISM="Rhodomonas sp., Strain CCMP768" /LENGTH=146 /DNA_ID=CAMNT_0049482825 /DNA_START=87 /DNA_END=527 /DNA_ORIENTATION=+